MISLPSRLTIQAFDDRALGDAALTIDKPGLACAAAPALPALANTFGNKATDLMSTRFQRMSGTVTTAIPSAATVLKATADRCCAR